jgi:hypothetical protein
VSAGLLVTGAVLTLGGLGLLAWGLTKAGGSDMGGIAAGPAVFAGVLALPIGVLIGGCTLVYVLPRRS